MRFDIRTYKGYNVKEHGQHSTELVLSVTGEEGAMVWRLSTGLGPTGPWPSPDTSGPLLYGVNLSPPMGMGVAAHSELTPHNASEESYKISDSCEFLNGRACVCDYSKGLDEDLMKAFACDGFEGAERRLTELYIDHYGKDS